jgi:hypothetical protein
MAQSKGYTIQDIKPRLRIFASSTDNFLVHASRLLSTSSGIDNTLSTVLFTATLLHSQLTRILARRYERLALALASKADTTLLPGQTIVASITPPPSKLSRTCASLKTLALTSGEMWMFLRLFGLFHIYRWAREFWEASHRDPSIKLLMWMQIAAASTFQAIENVAYLASKGILPGEKRAMRWMAISNRFWMLQVVLEGLRLLRVRQLGWREELGAESEEKEMKVQSDALRKRWRRDFYANAGWLPMTLHWSYEHESNSPVPEAWQGVVGLIPSIVGLQDAWRETA